MGAYIELEECDSLSRSWYHHVQQNTANLAWLSCVLVERMVFDA